MFTVHSHDNGMLSCLLCNQALARAETGRHAESAAGREEMPVLRQGSRMCPYLAQVVHPDHHRQAPTAVAELALLRQVAPQVAARPAPAERAPGLCPATGACFRLPGRGKACLGFNKRPAHLLHCLRDHPQAQQGHEEVVRLHQRANLGRFAAAHVVHPQVHAQHICTALPVRAAASGACRLCARRRGDSQQMVSAAAVRQCVSGQLDVRASATRHTLTPYSSVLVKTAGKWRPRTIVVRPDKVIHGRAERQCSHYPHRSRA